MLKALLIGFSGRFDRRTAKRYRVAAMPFGTAQPMPRNGFAGPVKRSITIAGHQTSISLEPIFWQALEQAARDAELPLSALVATIDAARIAHRSPPNLASALRIWLFANANERGSQ